MSKKLMIWTNNISRDMAAFQLINRTKNYLRDEASTDWHLSYRIKEQGTDTYCHDLNGLAMIIRVKYLDLYGFFWMYHISDVHLLIEYVHDTLKLEAHEIIVNPSVKLFYDIDMQISQTDLDRMIDYYGEYSGEYDLDINDVTRHLANLYFDATLISLSEHGNDLEQLQMSADMMYSSRNRPVGSDAHKLSIHVITNIVCSIEQCRAVVEDVKNNILHNPETYELNYDTDSHELIINSIDVQPYHKLGSLAITGGRKIIDGVEYINQLQQSFQLRTEEPFITRMDSFSNKINFSQYPVTITYDGGVGGVVSPEFVKQVYEHIQNVPYFNHSDWDLEAASYKGCVAIIRRVHPSFCAICERTHDLDNTLMIIFNEERGTGAWKCIRARDIKSKVFYRDESTDSEVELFVNHNKVMPKHDTIDSDEPIAVPQNYTEESVIIQSTSSIVDAPDDELTITIECLDDSDDESENINKYTSDKCELIDDNCDQTINHLSDSDSESDTIIFVSKKIIVNAPDRPIKLSIQTYISNESDNSDESYISEEESSDQETDLIIDEGYESDCDRIFTYPIRNKQELSDSSTVVTASGVLRYVKKNTSVL
jgi:hypothetical protein